MEGWPVSAGGRHLSDLGQWLSVCSASCPPALSPLTHPTGFAHFAPQISGLLEKPEPFYHLNLRMSKVANFAMESYIVYIISTHEKGSFLSSWGAVMSGT